MGWTAKPIKVLLSRLAEVAFRIAPGNGPTLTACLVARANYERWVVGVTTCEAADRSPSGCAGWKLAKWEDGGDNSKLLAGWVMKFDPGKLGVNYTPKVIKPGMITKQDRAYERELRQHHDPGAARERADAIGGGPAREADDLAGAEDGANRQHDAAPEARRRLAARKPLELALL